MTGPTDAPPPEDDGGADDDFLGELDDDMLLDALGQGGTEEGELGAMLGNWRDEVDSEPVPPIVERTQEIHALDQQFDKPAAPSGPRSTSERNTPKMSVQDESDKIRGLASSEDIPIERLHDAAERMKNLHAQARELVGPNSQHLGDLDGLAQMVADALETAIGAAKQYENKLHDAADAHARG